MSKLITFEEFKKSYLAEIYPRIDSFKDSIDDPYLTKVLSIKNAYDIFHPLGCDSSFIDKCELYHSLRYNIDDDGEISFVRCNYRAYNDVMSNYKKEDVWLNRVEYFVMFGHYTDLKDEDVLKIATTFGCFKSRPEELLAYHACLVGWDLIDVVLKYESIIEPTKELVKPVDDWKINRLNAIKRMEIIRRAEEEYTNYILSNKYMTERIVK